MSGETQKEADPQASSVPPPSPGDIPPSAPSDPATIVKSSTQPDGIRYTYILLAAFIVLVSGILVAVHLQAFLEDAKFRGVLVSPGMHKRLRGIVPRSSVDAGGPLEVPLMPIMGFSMVGAFGTWLIGATALALISWSSWRVTLWRWGFQFIWLWSLGLFEAIWDLTGAYAGGRLATWLIPISTILPLAHAFAWGGWIAGALGLVVSRQSDRLSRAIGHSCWAWASAVVFAITFSTLGILQYRALMVPHGDSAMYEEHLWNLLHGKGFRSQLDSGRLFFGEHLEVIHTLLLPIYIFLPSFVTLNVCLSLGLASGAIAVRGVTKRLTGSDGAANWMAIAYLLYFPLQYLDLEVSLKAFRPENFGVPLLLFAIWALEAKRYRIMLLLLGLTLLCKEDYAIPVGMVGLFLMTHRASQLDPRHTRWLGLGIFAFASCYLAFVLTIFIPAFRDGPPHYMAYYPDLGKTPLEIAANVIHNPGLLIQPLATNDNLQFIITLIGPLALLPLLGVGRIWLCLPTLVSILLIQLSDAHSPFFHFHAPLVPILFWAAAEGLNRIKSMIAWWAERTSIASENAIDPVRVSWPCITGFARLAAGCALVSGLFFGKSPLSLAFYDPDAGLRGYWKVLYCPNGMITLHLREVQLLIPGMTEQDVASLNRIGRVRSFDQLFAVIPADSAVAATDFVRPRFTHHRECHQYGEGGLKPHVNPDQIDYIVIDRIGPYSDWLGGQQLSELIEHPDRWEEMHWSSDGEIFFHVIKAKRD